MTETVLSSPTREVVIGFDRPFVVIGERINPTGRKALAAEMAAGNFDTVVADALAQVEAGAQMLDVNAGIPLADEPGDPRPHRRARPVDHRRPALDRLLHRRGARGRAGRLPRQGARQLRHRRGRADGARAPARGAPRRGRRRDHERRDGDQRGPRRPLRGRAEDRLARRGSRHSPRGRRRRPARDADRRDGHRRTPGLPAARAASRRAARQLDLRRLERQLRAAEPDGPQRGVPPHGDRLRADVRDHEPAPCRDAPGGEGRRRADGQRRALRRVDRAKRGRRVGARPRGVRGGRAAGGRRRRRERATRVSSSCPRDAAERCRAGRRCSTPRGVSGSTSTRPAAAAGSAAAAR